jgi:gluconolactonase
MREQPVNGVYRAAPDGTIVLVEGELSFPNGIVFSPDAKTLYVSVSDRRHAVVMAYDVTPDQRLSRPRVFSDMTPMVGAANPGVPDGMTVDEHGNLWTTGPGGVQIFTPGGKRLGIVRTGTAVANLVFGGGDGRTLFLTSDTMLVAVPTHVRGAVAREPAL